MSALVMGDYIVTKNPLHPTFLQHGKIAESHQKEDTLEIAY